MGYMHGIMVGVMMGFGAYLFTYLLGRFVESSILSRPDLRRAEEALPRRSLLEAKFDTRRSDRRARLGVLTAEITDLRRRRFLQDKALADARREAQAPIRVVGAEGQAFLKFRAWLVNRQVQMAVADRKRHPTLDGEWAQPQIVEVWADSLGDARKEIQRFYPVPLGFSTLSISLEQAGPAEGQETAKAVAG
ncbi:hypothetical protein SAMN05880556_101493 [Azospirillum sp. RU38E]|nr:hypothetical protein SAMN05880556_101493 [Azospirillum sp. RU38E]SNS07297.1 hypothetical protein SAMN05880591_101493 [Azospirillum sp. RU37A]